MFQRLTIKQIETFHWAARLGSFSATASRLNTTQPSISIRIRDMEEILRVTLFDRSGRLPRLTPKGRELAAHVERLVALGEEFDRLLGQPDIISGLVRVGAADTVALTWLPMLMAELGDRFPGINVELIVDLSVNLRARLHARDLDIAFLVGGVARQEFETRPLGRVAQQWMCSPRLGVSGAGLRGKDLTDWPVFTHSRGSDLHRAVMRWFDQEGTRPARLHGCSSLATMIAMTKAGLGISVLPPAMLEAEIASGELMKIRTKYPVPDNEFASISVAQPPRLAVSVVVDLAQEMVRQCPIFERKL